MAGCTVDIILTRMTQRNDDSRQSRKKANGEIGVAAENRKRQKDGINGGEQKLGASLQDHIDIFSWEAKSSIHCNQDGSK